MTEFAFHGNAALQMAPTAYTAGQTVTREEKKTEETPAASDPGSRSGGKSGGTGLRVDPAARSKWGWKTAPKAVGTIVLLAFCVVMILMSYAQLVMANDEVISLRNELKTLEAEETKLMAQYELSYDLQEIETQMLASGQMTKIQPWQTYALELSEPDSVEYYQGWDLKEKVLTFTQNLGTTVQEYFGVSVS